MFKNEMLNIKKKKKLNHTMEKNTSIQLTKK